MRSRTSGRVLAVAVSFLVLPLGGVRAGPGGAEPSAARPRDPGKAARAWSLSRAAEPYRGTTINAAFLPRPGYEAAIALIPEFEKLTGIRVQWESVYYEQMREAEVLGFTAKEPRFDVVLIDIVWIGEFAQAGWLAPLAPFIGDPMLADPALDLGDFFPVLLESFGTWDQKLYGLPFDNYSGLLFYNRCMLKKAGFARPPDTWKELRDVYGPALTRGERYAYALQSHSGETQSCDSFMRFVWPFGGSLLTREFAPNLSSRESLDGLRFRQDLLRYMPPGIVDMDHEETVKALAEERVAMITEWSGWYKWLASPATSQISGCLGVAVEPAGPAGRRPALGGFSLGIDARSSRERQAAAWLFVQWITSRQKARDFALAGGVPGRRSAYADPKLRKQFPHFEPLVLSWDRYANAAYRPRFREWPAISRIISRTGTDMMRGTVGVEDGAKRIDDQVEYILHEAGYYAGKPRLQ